MHELVTSALLAVPLTYDKIIKPDVTFCEMNSGLEKILFLGSVIGKELEAING